jgi:hypothetical protein
VDGFVRFAHGKALADDPYADAGEIGRTGEPYRRIRISSGFGNMQMLVTDGHLPYPLGREITEYEVRDIAVTLEKSKGAGVKILSAPYATDDKRMSAIVQFPGGISRRYIAWRRGEDWVAIRQSGDWRSQGWVAIQDCDAARMSLISRMCLG